MDVSISESGPDGGLAEAAKAYRQRWKKNLPTLHDLSRVEDLVLADGSTTVPNCRPSEVLVTLTAMAQLPPNTTIHTFVNGGGTVGEFAGEWVDPEDVVVDEASQWHRAFDQHIAYLDRVPPAYAPPGSGLVVRGGKLACFTDYVVLERKLRIINLWWLLRRHLGGAPGAPRTPETTLRVTRLEHLMRGRGTTLGNLGITKLPTKKSFGRFPCPDCSYQAGEAVYHSLRPGPKVTGLRSTREIKCRGAQTLLRLLGMDLAPVNIGDLIETTGFIPSGQMIYRALCATARGGLFMRDYSKARGIPRQVVWEWPSDWLWVTTRIYVRYENDPKGPEPSYADFEEAVRKDPTAFARLIRLHSLISNGKVLTVLI